MRQRGVDFQSTQEFWARTETQSAIVQVDEAYGRASILKRLLRPLERH